MLLKELLTATRGVALATSETQFQAVSTDSRLNLRGQIFFALRGERFDAHQFVRQAIQNGAACVVVDQPPDLQGLPAVTVVQVRDTLQALQDFAHHWRKSHPAQIVALTGSFGKTTTKQFVTSLLCEQFDTHSNEGSFNNHWGVPLTLLKIEDHHQKAVIEMGMNHAGEIQRLCEIAEPDIVTCITVGRAHIEFFGSLEKIAQAKQEIYLASPQAIGVFNIDNPLTRAMKADHRGAQLTFSGEDRKADVFLQLKKWTPQSMQITGSIGGVLGDAEVAIYGAHNLVNLQAAAALALAAGTDAKNIWQGFRHCASSWGRNQWLRLTNGAQVLFDAYNANPDSMGTALTNLKDLTQKQNGRVFAVLGEMKELGEHSAKLHFELGRQAALVDFECIYYVGAFAAEFEAGLKAQGFNKKLMKSNTCEQKLALELGSMLKDRDIVMVKGSRGVHLEDVVSAWHPESFQPKY